MPTGRMVNLRETVPDFRIWKILLAGEFISLSNFCKFNLI